MNSKQAMRHSCIARNAAKAALGAMVAGTLVLSSALAVAQTAAPAPASEPQGFFAKIGQWFKESSENFNAGMRDMREHFGSFTQEAGIAAKTTVNNTKAAADAMGRLSKTQVIYGHAVCKVAPNGAPDCVAAANAMCKGKGFASGSSVDMTTAEVCSAEVYLAGRNSGPGCHTETFVSRAMCQ